jgi:hypothetical protein
MEGIESAGNSLLLNKLARQTHGTVCRSDDMSSAGLVLPVQGLLADTILDGFHIAYHTNIQRLRLSD